MAEDKCCTKWAPDPSMWRRRYAGNKETFLRGEKDILEMISMGVPLSSVLNRLCAGIDLQIGNVVSVILSADDREHDLLTITHNALQFGLHVFWSASIPLPNEDVLGSLEMYCCIPRTPTPFEIRLIERVSHLAAVAIQRRNDEEDLKKFLRGRIDAWRKDAHERVYLN
jgi:GAF domain-containing protein